MEFGDYCCCAVDYDISRANLQDVEEETRRENVRLGREGKRGSKITYVSAIVTELQSRYSAVFRTMCF